MRRLVAAVALAAAALGAAAPAAADGVLDRAEQWDGDEYGLIYCEILGKYPNVVGVSAVLGSIRGDGFDSDSALDVLHYVTVTYCPAFASIQTSPGPVD